MKVLVTGGAGFIGSHLVDRLINDGFKVVVIDNLSSGKKKNLNPKAKFYKLDICSPKLADVFKKEKFDYVFHLAAQINLRKSVEDPIASANTNIKGSLNLLECSKMFNINKFIFTSTGGAIYGDANIVPTPESYTEEPLSPYGVEKLSVDKYLNYYYQVFGLKYNSLRLGNVYGPRQNSKGEAGVVSIFCENMVNGKSPVIYGSGRKTRDFVYVTDIVNAQVLAMKSKKIGVFNIGTGKETNINTIFKLLNKSFDNKYKAKHDLEKAGEQKRSCLNNSKAKKDLKWKPVVRLDDGLVETVKWFKNEE
ncbi:MAG: GDP-mannose 4,6-dehydratase [Candidatus Pacebacteria bacterium]|nr:GDP-mannose 4,6-dehydratase [Candidatus Paceibacterota bacterium]